MREIKFRAWDGFEMKPVEMLVTYDEPLHGISTEEDAEAALGEVFFFDENTSEFYPTDVQVMQFTGLKDKNGKEIYEGDIVRAQNITQRDFIDVVRYDTTNANFLFAALRGIEVIGNIYENPELLK